ncbi:MAG: hypothetical protein OQK35_08040 [Alphaproteobacteria bacterium]|nr:hypothetical protein [Rhodospirillales bacterium]MCW9046268.1 hypothetical protein [Alphaproteobacteria bacterium]
MTDDEKSANAELSESEYLMLASEGVAEAAINGPVPVDPDLADYMGAFEEDALSEEDAIDSFFDGVEPIEVAILIEAVSIKGAYHEQR